MNEKINSIWYIAAGIGGGFLAGFLGIGGGIILVPMMVGMLRLTQHKAHGTSLAIIVPIAAIAALVYALLGDINWLFVVTIGLGSILGVTIGAKVMVKIPAARLQQMFGVYAVIVAVLLLF